MTDFFSHFIYLPHCTFFKKLFVDTAAPYLPAFEHFTKRIKLVTLTRKAISLSTKNTDAKKKRAMFFFTTDYSDHNTTVNIIFGFKVLNI